MAVLFTAAQETSVAEEGLSPGSDLVALLVNV